MDESKRDAVVIVALPSNDDRRVYKVSSEKKPHLTLLFLGETDLGGESEAVFRFVEHAAKTSLRRFGMSVSKRGVLGDEGADVLFFDKDYAPKELFNFRTHLLANPHISTAYNNVEQYPEWLPHLTLGYPETPARDDDEDYPIQWVNFDRIAIWTGDSEGPEFELEENRTMEVAMSSTSDPSATEKVLKHYGRKGMKWGVRRTPEQLAEASEDFKVAAAAKAKPASSLSNTEMRALIDRMNLERQYSQLMTQAPSKTRVTKGKQYVGKLLVDVGTEQARRVARAAATKKVDEVMNKKGLNVPEQLKTLKGK